MTRLIPLRRRTCRRLRCRALLLFRRRPALHLRARAILCTPASAILENDPSRPVITRMRLTAHPSIDPHALDEKCLGGIGLAGVIMFPKELLLLFQRPLDFEGPLRLVLSVSVGLIGLWTLYPVVSALLSGKPSIEHPAGRWAVSYSDHCPCYWSSQPP
jgi:hypothetical protein